MSLPLVSGSSSREQTLRCLKRLVELIADEIEFEDSNGALSRVYSMMWASC